MDPMELLLSLPEWVFTVEFAAVAGLVACMLITWGICRLIPDPAPKIVPMHIGGTGGANRFDVTGSNHIGDDPLARICDLDAEGGYHATRREALDRVLAGKMEWDDYLEYFRGWPDDGSLRAEKHEEAQAKHIAEALEKAAKPMLIASGPKGEIKWPVDICRWSCESSDVPYFKYPLLHIGVDTPSVNVPVTFESVDQNGEPILPPPKESTVLRRENPVLPEDWEVTKSPACTMRSHPGVRVSRDRVSTINRHTVVFQPKSGEWVDAGECNYAWHPCCQKNYVWFTQFRGAPQG